MKKLKICIVGCGAIGTWLGAHLANSPQVELSCIVRSHTISDIKQSGLRVDFELTQATSVIGHPVFVTNDPQDLGPQDWIIVAIKATGLTSLISELRPLIGEHTSIWTAMNGLPWWFTKGLTGAVSDHSFKTIDPRGLIENSIPLKHWVGGVVHASCSLKGPGHALHHFGKGLIVGEPVNKVENREKVEFLSSRSQEFTNLLCSVGFEAKASSHIQKDIWYKLWGNMTMNPISALTGATTDKILDDPLVNTFITQIMLEAKSIGQVIGLPIEQSPEDRHAMTRKLGAFKTSMLQDLENHRPVELDVLLNAVLELAACVNVPTPFTNALMGLARVQMQKLGLY